jgi:hypothetical protein
MDCSATPNDLPGAHQQVDFAALSDFLATRAVLTPRRPF